MSFFFSERNLGKPGGDLHVWFGPLGFHLYWPRFWHMRADWCSRWDKYAKRDEPFSTTSAESRTGTERTL